MPRISLYIREKTDGGWRYRRIKEGRGFKISDLTPPFFTRRRMDGKQVWKGLYAETFRQAKAEAAHFGGAVETESRGVTQAQTEPARTINRMPLVAAIETYLE